MKTVIFLLSVLICSQRSLANGSECKKALFTIIETSESALKNASYSRRMFHEKNVGSVLDLSYDEFMRRLEKFDVTAEYFFEMVTKFEKGEHQFHLIRSIKDAIRFRNITNDSFMKIYLTETAVTLSLLSKAHILNHGDERLGYFIAQFTSVMFTEMALVFASADNAAKLVAEGLIKTSKNAVGSLDSQVKESLLKRFKKMDKNVYSMIKKSYSYGADAVVFSVKKMVENFKQIAGASFLIGVIPYSIEALVNTATLGGSIEKTLVSLSFQTLFIGVWSNLRGAFLYGKLYPDLNRVLSDHEITLWAMYWCFVVVNANIGGEHFSLWAVTYEEKYEELKNMIIENG